MIPDAKKFVGELIESWNSHDIERIMKHYSGDCELRSPFIKKLLGIESGALHGKERIEEFWKLGLARNPDLHLELIDIAECVDTLAIYYKSIKDRKAIEIMFFNEKGEVNKVFVHYN